jgi:hypothetical protein
MLDIKIRHFFDKIDKMKQPEAAQFCKQNIRVVEKLDGTKLTVIRTDEDLNEDDPLQGWIISYKEDIIYPEETEGLGPDRSVATSKIRSGYPGEKGSEGGSGPKPGATGRLWYRLVVDHLKEQMSDGSKFDFWQRPENRDLEIFIEFIQRKGTLARKYQKLGGLYLTAIGKSQYSKAGGRVTSVVGSQITDPEMIENVRENLDLSEYPLIFSGTLQSSDSMIEGSVNEEIRSKFENKQEEIDGLIERGDWKGALSIVDEIFKDFESSLGDTAEGVVISVESNRDLYKTYSAGQSSARKPGETDEEYKKRIEAELAVREKSKELSGAGTAEEDSIFYTALGNFIKTEILENDFKDPSPERSIRKAMKYFSNLFTSMSEDDFKIELKNAIGSSIDVPFGKRDLIRVQEAAINSARSIVGRFADAGMLTGEKRTAGESYVIGIVPMAAKPLHLGHWNIIEKAAENCDIVYLIVSGKSRASGNVTITGEQMGEIWMKILKRYLPGNVVLSFSSSTPISSTTGVISKFVNEPNVLFYVYSGEPDATRGEDVQIMSKAKEAAGKRGASDRVVPKVVETMLIPSELYKMEEFKQLQETPEFSKIPDPDRVSGTLMRLALQYGTKSVFFALLPRVSDSDKAGIWNILHKPASLLESSVRYFIRESLRLT